MEMTRQHTEALWATSNLLAQKKELENRLDTRQGKMVPAASVCACLGMFAEMCDDACVYMFAEM